MVMGRVSWEVTGGHEEGLEGADSHLLEARAEHRRVHIGVGMELGGGGEGDAEALAHLGGLFERRGVGTLARVDEPPVVDIQGEPL